jgi:hypothetical protein
LSVSCDIYDPFQDKNITVTDEILVAVSLPVAKEFIITINPADITRGVNSSFEISARDDGEINTLYTPLVGLAIVFTSTDGGDVLSKTIINPGDWSGGVALFDIQVNGGISTAVATFSVEDVTNGYSGSVISAVAPTWQNVAAISSIASYTSYNTGLLTGETDEFNGTARWTEVANNSLVPHSAESLSPSGTVSERVFQDEYNYPSMRGQLRDSAQQYNLTVSQRDNIIAGNIEFDWLGYEGINAGTRLDENYFNNGSVKIKLAEAFSELDTVVKISTSTTFSISFAALNQLANLQGARYWTGTRWNIDVKTVYVPMPEAMVDYIKAMTGTTLYMSIYLSPVIYSYKYPDYTGGDHGSSSNNYRGTSISSDNTLIRVLT